MNLSALDLAFTLDVLERKGKFHSARTAPDGRFRPIVEATLGVKDAHRLAAILDTEARPNGSKLRVRLRGTRAEEFLTEILPLLSERSRSYAVPVLERAAVLRERREARQREAAKNEAA